MAKAKSPVPQGFHTLTPQVTVNNAAAYIDFLTRAFGAVERMRAPGPGARLMHAEVTIGDSILMFADDFPEYCQGQPLAQGRMPYVLQLYVPDVDTTFAQAVAAGCTVVFPLADQFWGDRYGQVMDPFGVRWGIATHTEDLTLEELQQRQAKAFSGGAGAA